MPLDPDRLLRHIERQPHRRATFKQLLRELGIKAAARRELKPLLAELVRQRRLTETRHHFELPPAPTPAHAGRPPLPRPHPAPAAGEIAGRISVHRDGFAFVLPRDPQAQPIAGDIFIPPPFVGAAMHGDTVAVRLLRRTGEGRAEGKVTRILHRAHGTVVGEFHYGRQHNFVRPYDDRLRDPIIIPRGQEWPPDAAETDAHRVLGAEARRRPRGGAPAAAVAAPSSRPSLEGLIVDAAITHYPTPTSEARGRVIEILGQRGDFGIDVEIIIRKYHLPHRFPDEVLAEAETAPATIAAAETASRRDFRAFPVLTIDGETARDFDDAVHVRRLEDGEYELQVHIADVAHYVAPGCAMDREARLRGTSVYFPDRAVPMLPVQLSTDLCSLRPEVDRLVMSCVMRFDREGRPRGYELTPGVIRSAARMTYTDVNALLNGDSVLRERYGALAAHFPPMLALQQLLNRRRMSRGSIDFDMPEPEITFDEFGLMRAIVKSERNVAHRIIEEFMLAANETVASHLEALGIAALYRIHEKPDARKVAEFEEIAAAFGYTLGVAVPMRRIRQRVAGRVRSTLIPGAEPVPVTPRHYQRLAERISGKPEERILSFLMLRSLKQARYSPKNDGHFALAMGTYTHFTSPIRRYPDLLVHRMLKAVLPAGGVRLLGSPGEAAQNPASLASAALPPLPELRILAEETSDCERRADEAERELLDWKKVRYMEARLGEEFACMILHVTKAGFFVELVDLFIEGFVPMANLPDDRYVFREGAHELVGERSKRRYRVGDRLHVIVDRVDPIRHKIDFAPV